jgi:pimeloyl-ACP methyl ester carboxylesterase
LKSSPALKLFARPWIDPVCLWGLKHLFPASRAWAAANISDGDLDRFAAELGLDRVPAGIGRRVNRTVALRRAADDAFARWNDRAFATSDIAAIENERRNAAHAWFAHRLNYLMFAKRHGLPAVQLAVPTPAEAMDLFAGHVAEPDRFFSLPPSLPGVERSGSIETGNVIEYWLRFPSPDGEGDTVYAHVYEPKQRPAGGYPTLIFGHGLAVETEMMKGDLRGYGAVAERGIRLILPDAPGHNRRVAHGRYGGESFIAAPPVSSLHHLAQAAKEFGIIAAWARGNGSKRVAFGGMSLGALTSQVAAVRMATWQAEARPDALMLLTTTDRVSSLALDSALAVITGLNAGAVGKGWAPSHFAPLAGIVDASATPPLDPEHIVLMIGARDTVTPIDGGRRLARQWRVPERNLFQRDQGHFSAALGLGIDPSPFRRIQEILAA